MITKAFLALACLTMTSTSFGAIGSQDQTAQTINLNVVGTVTTLDGVQVQQSDLQTMESFPTLTSDVNAVSAIKSVVQTPDQTLELYDSAGQSIGEIDLSQTPMTLSGMDDVLAPKFITFASSPMTPGQSSATSATLQFDFDECTAVVEPGVVQNPDLVKGEPMPSPEQQEEDRRNAEAAAAPQECRALVVILALQPAPVAEPIAPATPAQP